MVTQADDLSDLGAVATAAEATSEDEDRPPDLGDSGPYEGGGVSWQVPGSEARPGRSRRGEPVEAEAVVVVAREVVGDVVPIPAEGEQPVRIDTPLTAYLVFGCVAEVETLAVAASLGEGDERIPLDLRRRLTPPRRR